MNNDEDYTQQVLIDYINKLETGMRDILITLHKGGGDVANVCKQLALASLKARPLAVVATNSDHPSSWQLVHAGNLKKERDAIDEASRVASHGKQK